MNIYPLEFQPTYLCIKQHTITGKLYFCKTTRSDKQMLKYKGSGKHWKNHLKKHGKESVETIWYCLFTEKEELVKFALMCSDQWDIVKSKEWANEKPENGLDGNAPGSKHSKDTLKKLVYATQNRTSEQKIKWQKKALDARLSRSESEKKETGRRMSRSRTGKVKPKEAVDKTLDTRANWSEQEKSKNSQSISDGLKNKPKSESHKQNLRKPKKRSICPHCGKEGPVGHMKRYHSICNAISL